MPASMFERLVAAMADPATFPWHPPTVELIETHMSWVALAGDRVVKVRRPVAYSFVDHTTLAARERSARDEVRVNRRLTDDVYLGVEPICDDGGRFRLGGDGPVVEWATVMRRLPNETMLDRLIERGTVPDDAATRLAARLVPFHRSVAARCDAERCGSTAALLKVLTNNLEDLEPFAGTLLGSAQLELVARSVHAAVAELAPLTEQRRQDGWIRDGHGDLRAEHVNLESATRTQVFDAVEFSPAIRCADVASDLAYLLVDLRRRGADRLAAVLLAAERAGGVELPNRLLRLYMAHRALVKAKIVCLNARSSGSAPDAVAEARSALDAATWAALSVRPAVVAMTGLSGTGKSTVAQRIGRCLGIDVCSSDTVRRDLFPEPDPKTRYAGSATATTYQALLDQASTALDAGRGVVLDATFQDAHWRSEVSRLAAARGVPAFLVETVADLPITLERLRRRAAAGASLSEADAAVHLAQRARASVAPPTVPAGLLQVIVRTDTSHPDPLDPFFRAASETGALGATIPDTEPFRAGEPD